MLIENCLSRLFDIWVVLTPQERKDLMSVAETLCANHQQSQITRLTATLRIDNILEDAAKVLITFIRTAPGRLPSRVQEAIGLLEECATSEVFARNWLTVVDDPIKSKKAGMTDGL